MEIELGNYIIDIVHVPKDNKNIYFRFKDDLKLYVTASRFVSKREIEKLVKKNEEAILKMYEHKLEEAEADKYFNYLGERYSIYIDCDSNIVRFVDDIVYTPSIEVLDKFYASQCKKIFLSRVEKFSEVVKSLPSFELKIRKMKTRWGVCNRGNNTITLNSELLKKDVTLIDYVIIHEMCHFHHPDHSARFWALVEVYYPYYKQARKMLKHV